MFLSNPQVAALALSLLIVAGAGCSWLSPSEPVTLTPTVVAHPESSLPFESQEPATYQADFLTIMGGSETRSHFARKEGKWRIDTFAGEKATRSIINGEKCVYVDHATKQYSEPPITGHDPQPQFIKDLRTSLLSEGQPVKFEKLSPEGTLERFSVTAENSNSSSMVVFDTAIKMVVRHEFENGFAFEMRNFTLEVGDNFFAVPSGYRKVSWTAFNQL